MAKFSGYVGFVTTESEVAGVYVEQAEEHYYYGDITRNTSKYQSSETLNDDINISNEISIVADPFAYANFHHIRYVEFMSTKWKVTNVTVQYPRLTLTLGGEWNGTT